MPQLHAWLRAAVLLLPAEASGWGPDSGVTGLAFEDTDTRQYMMGGQVVWTPPGDAAGIEAYAVFIAHDEQNTRGAQLWDNDLEDMWVPVGTNQLSVYLDTRRQTLSAGLPANWLLVFASRGHGRADLQPASLAAKIPLYDASGDVPGLAPISGVSFSDTDAAASQVGGKVTWVPDASADLGFTTRYAVYLSTDSHGSDEVFVGEAARGAAEFDVPAGTQSGERDHVLVYAENPNGRSAAAASAAFEHLGGTVRSTGTWTTIGTVLPTTSPGSLASSVSGVAYTDTRGAPYVIEGSVTWTPPADTSHVTRYAVFIAYDEENTNGAQLWDAGLEDMWVPVGTNRLEMYQDTIRQTDPAGLPAQWLLVFAWRDDLGGLQPAGEAAKIPLFDDSGAPPDPVAMGGLTFADSDPSAGSVGGVARWEPLQGADLAFTTHYSVYLAQDSRGAGEALVGTVPRGTTEITIPAGTACAGGGRHLLVYAQNARGRAAAAAALAFGDLGSVSATATATSTTTSTSTFAESLATATGLEFTDTSADANVIEGTIRWNPPAETSVVTRYAAFIAYDEHNTRGAQLWDNERSDMWVPVGTNQLDIYHGTVRQTSPAGLPAQWLLLFAWRQDLQRLQDAEHAAKIPLYDDRGGVPDAIPMTTLAFTDTDPAAGKIGGTAQWAPEADADLGFTTGYAAYLALDGHGTGAQHIQDVPRGSTALLVPAGTDCGLRRHLLVYARNSHGRSATAASVAFEDLGGVEVGSLTSSTTTTTSTSTLAGASSATGLSYADTNASPYIIEGIVRWTPPAHSSMVTRYAVYVAYDEENTGGAQLWDGDREDMWVPVGTNHLNIQHDTRRQTTRSGLPAQWLLVFTWRQDLGLQDAADAAKIPLYDSSGDVPGAPDMSSVAFVDTDPAPGTVGGTLRWSPRSDADLAFTTHYAVYLAEDAQGTGEERLGSVPRGAIEFAIPAGTSCGQRRHALVYAENPNGRSAAAAAAEFQDLGAEEPDTATSTASPTSTTLPADSPMGVTNVTYTDTHSAAYMLEGVVEWTPPADTSQITRYAVFIAYDEQNTRGAQLWDYTLEDKWVPVGPNRLNVYQETRRQTDPAGLPAQWLIVFAWRQDLGALQAVGEAGRAPLYDDSGSVPGGTGLSSLSFTDTDPGAGTVGGTLRLAPAAGLDLGFITHFDVYLSQDVYGTNEASIGSLPRGATEFPIPGGTHCGHRRYVLVYARNPHGRSAGSASAVFEDLGGSVVTPPPTTTSTTVTTPTSIGVSSVTNLAYSDTNADAYVIEGLVQWSPPVDASTVTRYAVFIAGDEENTGGAQLWDNDIEDMWVPVGTNHLNIYHGTRRQTAVAGLPANYLLVFAWRQGPGAAGSLQPAHEAAKIPLRDLSRAVPPAVEMSSLTFTDTDPRMDQVGGTVQWAPAEGADLGFVASYTVCLAGSTGGMDEDCLQPVPAGTGELPIPPGTACSGKRYLLIYAQNGNGRSHTAASAVFEDLATAATTTATATATMTPSTTESSMPPTTETMVTTTESATSTTPTTSPVATTTSALATTACVEQDWCAMADCSLDVAATFCPCKCGGEEGEPLEPTTTATATTTSSTPTTTATTTASSTISITTRSSTPTTTATTTATETGTSATTTATTSALATTACVEQDWCPMADCSLDVAAMYCPCKCGGEQGEPSEPTTTTAATTTATETGTSATTSVTGTSTSTSTTAPSTTATESSTTATGTSTTATGTSTTATGTSTTTTGTSTSTTTPSATATGTSTTATGTSTTSTPTSSTVPTTTSTAAAASTPTPCTESSWCFIADCSISAAAAFCPCSCAVAAETTGTTTTVLAPAGFYIDGPRVGSTAHAGHCSTWHGTLESAATACGNELGCSVLYSQDCSGGLWRYCHSPIAAIQSSSDTGTGACTKLLMSFI